MSDWPSVELIEVCTEIVDCINKTAPKVDYETPYKMIRTTNVKNGVVNTKDVKYVTEETYKKWTRRSVPQYGDVILTREAPLGQVGMITVRGEKIFLGQRLMSYRADPEKLDKHFLLYALQESYMQGQIKSFGSGSTVEHMRVGDAEKIKIKLPPLPVQQKIASILSSYDDLIENNNRRIAILEEMAQKLYREWFVKFRFPGYEKVKMVESELGLIPEGWEVVPFGSMVQYLREPTPKGLLSSQTAYMGLEHFPRKSIALSDWEYVNEIGSSKLKFQKGDILFGKIRPYFHKVGVAQTDGICSSDTFVWRPKKEYYALAVMIASSDDFVAQSVQTSQGTKMPRANWNVLKEYKVVIPPNDLLKRFDDIVKSMIENIHNLSAKNRNLKYQRDLLLPKLISGKVKVNDEE